MARRAAPRLPAPRRRAFDWRGECLMAPAGKKRRRGMAPRRRGVLGRYYPPTPRASARSSRLRPAGDPPRGGPAIRPSSSLSRADANDDEVQPFVPPTPPLSTRAGASWVIVSPSTTAGSRVTRSPTQDSEVEDRPALATSSSGASSSSPSSSPLPSSFSSSPLLPS